jgi:hypothetical protein
MPSDIPIPSMSPRDVGAFVSDFIGASQFRQAEPCDSGPGGVDEPVRMAWKGHEGLQRVRDAAAVRRDICPGHRVRSIQHLSIRTQH